MHRDEIPAPWALNPDQLPCILWSAGEGASPTMLVSKKDIAGCADVAALERCIATALARVDVTAAR